MKYNFGTKTKFWVLTLAFILITSESHAQISAQLKIELDGEACTLLLNKTKELHTMLEETLAGEFLYNKQQIKNSLTNYLITEIYGCNISELMKVRAAKDPLVKVLLALCDASSMFIKEIMQQGLPQSNLYTLKIQALEALSKIKSIAMNAGLVGSSTSKITKNTAAVEKCYILVTTDLKTLITTQPHISINNIATYPYSTRFPILFKQALVKNLSDDDVTKLTNFFQSTAYTKLKQHIPQIIRLVLEKISPDVKTKTESMLTNFWDETGAIIIAALQKFNNPGQSKL